MWIQDSLFMLFIEKLSKTLAQFYELVLYAKLHKYTLSFAIPNLKNKHNRTQKKDKIVSRLSQLKIMLCEIEKPTLYALYKHS